MRKSGILMPIFSLPNKYGIGDFGPESYKFVDFLCKAGQKVWQVLPLVQTGFGNSPYSSVSSKSFNPYFISPELLLKDGLCTVEEINFSLYDGKYIDYGFLYTVRYPLLKKAFSRFDKGDKDFVEFVNNKTAYDYALFMTLKYASGQKHFYEWQDEYKYRDKDALEKFANDYYEDILFWQFVQFIARKQWFELKKYANGKGISIIGDMPLYVALDSVDVWTFPKCFKLDDNFVPEKVAGVPPDYFSENGQLWGNPVYDYEYLKKDNFSWWVDRLSSALSVFDILRIDHFRGLDRYYEVNSGAMDARVGEWIKVPSDELFSAIFLSIDKKRIIAEDLGIIDDGVRELLKKTGFPGMKILSFAFNGEKDNLYLPENIGKNSVCYTGTHDNDTLKGLIKSMSSWDYNNLITGVNESLKKFGMENKTDSIDELIDAVIELGEVSLSDLFIIPLADALKGDTDYRINEPGTVKPQNWAVKFDENDIGESVVQKLKELAVKYNRI